MATWHAGVTAALLGAALGAWLRCSATLSTAALHAPAHAARGATLSAPSIAFLTRHRAADAQLPATPLRLASTLESANGSGGPKFTGHSLPAVVGVLTALNVVAVWAYTGTRRANADVGRRDALVAIGSWAAAGSLAAAGPAAAAPTRAVDLEKEYKEDTAEVLGKIKRVVSLAVPKGDPELVEAVNDCRPAMIDWVAKYRGEPRFSGRGSYGATYTAINALAGHWGDVGRDFPFPPKRATRVLQNVATAQDLLARGR